MSVGLYMDVHIPLAVTVGLRARGIDVVTAQEDRPPSDWRSVLSSSIGTGARVACWALFSMRDAACTSGGMPHQAPRGCGTLARFRLVASESRFTRRTKPLVNLG